MDYSSRFAVAAVVLLCCILTKCTISAGLARPNKLINAVRQPGFKIIGGDKASVEDYPFIVSLQRNGTFYGHDVEHFCCGVIVSDQFVITTAQCAETTNGFFVRSGTNQYYQGGAIHQVEQVKIHPDYNQLSNDCDLALIKLSSKINFDERTQSAKLAMADFGIKSDVTVDIAGWGALQMLMPVSDDLYGTKISKITQQECSEVYGAGAITENMFCTYKDGFGACIGDSGSPAVYNGVVYGLASFSYRCAAYPTGYVNLAKMLKWIRTETKA